MCISRTATKLHKLIDVIYPPLLSIHNHLKSTYTYAYACPGSATELFVAKALAGCCDCTMHTRFACELNFLSLRRRRAVPHALGVGVVTNSIQIPSSSPSSSSVSGGVLRVVAHEPSSSLSAQSSVWTSGRNICAEATQKWPPKATTPPQPPHKTRQGKIRDREFEQTTAPSLTQSSSQHSPPPYQPH